MNEMELNRHYALLERIREDQLQILEQQKKILGELAEIRQSQKKMQQEMAGDQDHMDLLASRNGMIQ